MTRTLITTFAVLLTCALGLGTNTRAEDALEPINVGTPTKIEVFPPAIKLQGPRRKMQLVVTGFYGDGQVQDLTRAAQFASSDVRRPRALRRWTLSGNRSIKPIYCQTPPSPFSRNPEQGRDFGICECRLHYASLCN